MISLASQHIQTYQISVPLTGWGNVFQSLQASSSVDLLLYSWDFSVFSSWGAGGPILSHELNLFSVSQVFISSEPHFSWAYLPEAFWESKKNFKILNISENILMTPSPIWYFGLVNILGWKSFSHWILKVSLHYFLVSGVAVKKC